MATYCGQIFPMGHGEAATCGKQFYQNQFQCKACVTADMAKLQTAHVLAVTMLDALIASQNSSIPVQLSELNALRAILTQV
jgi:hypothetical protein